MQLFHANNQNNLRRNRIFRDRLNPLDAYDDHELLYRYRMSRQTLMRVIDMVRDDIVHETQRSYALTPEQQTFAAIRYYATGSFQTVVGDSHQCQGLSRECLLLYVVMPDNTSDFRQLLDFSKQLKKAS